MVSVQSLILIAVATLASVVTAEYGEMHMPEGLTPRFYLGVSKQLVDRQSGLCAANSHSCADVNSTVCCPNTQYCIVDSTFKAQCCEIGSDCNNPCGITQYQCPSTTTVRGVATVVPACCPRSCPVSAFKCAQAYGGGCCSYGSTCGEGGACSSTVKPTTSRLVAEVPSGCTTSQIACPTSVGGGCCNVGLSCTVLDNPNYCASASGSAVRTGPDGILASQVPKSSGNSALSTGAKAGIGAGLAVGSLVVLGALTWFCLVHRRLIKQSERSHSTSEPDMTEASSSGGRPLPGRQASDYFGPKATSGPFTDDSISSASSPGIRRAVPGHPHAPGDIAAPVEIDSRHHSNVPSPGFFECVVSSPESYEDTKGPVTRAYPVELP